jgi:NAD(P)-dependent dehydrogenase (short-subunit alcohol dehydrogenase family)
MAGRLAGKVVVVSGGSSGIGRAVAERVAAEGARVVVGARRTDTGAQVVDGIRARGGEARFVAMDATDEGGAAALVGAALEGSAAWTVPSTTSEGCGPPARSPRWMAATGAPRSTTTSPVCSTP